MILYFCCPSQMDGSTPRDEIGRRARLKIWWMNNPCWFEPGRGDQNNEVKDNCPFFVTIIKNMIKYCWKAS